MGIFSHYPSHEIINEKHFTLDLHCSLPTGQETKVEFQIHKPYYVLMKCYTDEHNTVNFVYNHDKKEIACFWKNIRGVLNTETYPPIEKLQPALLLLPHYYDIIQSFKTREIVDLKDEEKSEFRLGNSKFTSINGDLKYHYYQVGQGLSGLGIERSVNSEMILIEAKLWGGRVLLEHEYMVLPEGLRWQAADSLEF